MASQVSITDHGLLLLIIVVAVGCWKALSKHAEKDETAREADRAEAKEARETDALEAKEDRRRLYEKIQSMENRLMSKLEEFRAEGKREHDRLSEKVDRVAETVYRLDGTKEEK